MARVNCEYVVRIAGRFPGALLLLHALSLVNAILLYCLPRSAGEWWYEEAFVPAIAALIDVVHDQGA